MTSFPWSALLSNVAVDQSAREKSLSYCKNMNVRLKRRVKDPWKLFRTLNVLVDLVDEHSIPFLPYKIMSMHSNNHAC